MTPISPLTPTLRCQTVTKVGYGSAPVWLRQLSEIKVPRGATCKLSVGRARHDSTVGCLLDLGPNAAHLTFGTGTLHGHEPNVRCITCARILNLLVFLMSPTLSRSDAATGTKCRRANTSTPAIARTKQEGRS